MNILELAILKKMVGGGGGSGTDNYNDLSNLPQINGETLAGNKTAENLGLQDALTFDSAPTEDSANPVESGGVYNALTGKQDNLTFDDDPTENSTNPVKSGGVYSALAGKQDNLTFDGVYNASTNKAATESTVTNAINGLDVSALSVDADETISSISEIDGKISVTKQDIAIASNQVVAMTGYTKPSSAPATPAIQTSDTANQAFGKLEFKADTNQTNILYVSEHNANRNLLLNTASTTTIDGVTFTVNADKSVTITGSQNNPNQHTKFVLGKFTANRSDLVLDSGIAASASANIFINTQDGVTTTRNLGHATITGTDLNTERDYQILVIAGTSNINTTIKPMICTQADWNATQEYEASGGLPNYDLTRLESEDRAGLVECVDGGAKNQLNVALDTIKGLNAGGTWTNNQYVNYGVTFTVNSDGTVTATGTADAQHNASLILAKYSTSSSVEGMVLSGVPNVNGARIAIQRNSSPWSTVVYIDSGTSDKIIPAFNYESILFCMVSGGSTVTNAVFKPMICTKAAFGVSNKFAPYNTMAQWTKVEKEYTSTAADTMEYCGISFTVPANEIYEFIVMDRYNAGKPNGIGVADNSTNYNSNSTVIAENMADFSVSAAYPWARQVTGMTIPRSQDTRYYVWVKRGTASKNTVYLMYRRIL